MTEEKLISVLEFYNEALALFTPGDPGDPCSVHHLRWMCKTAVGELIPRAKHWKANRWLGYIQGVLVAKGIYTLEQVKRHSMPDGEKT